MSDPAFDAEDVSAFLDGELHGAAADTVRARLVSDPEAARRADELRALSSLLGELPAASASDALVRRALERARGTDAAARFRRRVLRAAAAVVVAAVCAGTWFLRPGAAGAEPSEPQAGASEIAALIPKQQPPRGMTDVADALSEIDAIQTDYFGAD